MWDLWWFCLHLMCYWSRSTCWAHFGCSQSFSLASDSYSREKVRRTLVENQWARSLTPRVKLQNSGTQKLRNRVLDLNWARIWHSQIFTREGKTKCFSLAK